MNCSNCQDKSLSTGSVVNAVFDVAGDILTNQQNQAWLYPQCGKRPFFVGQKRTEWEQCAALARQQQSSFNVNVQNPNNLKSKLFDNYKKPLIIGAVALAAFLIYKSVNKK